MIERCNYCGKEHETGEGPIVRECPDVPENYIYAVPSRVPMDDKVVYIGNLGWTKEARDDDRTA